MRIKRLIVLLTVILVAAAGCQRIEKAASNAESTLKELVDVPEKSTGNAETGSDFAETGDENAETRTENTETGSENAETESGTSGPESTSDSEQGTKEEQQFEAGQQTGPETETVPEEKPIELVYELEPGQENYLFSIRKQSIVREGDVYYMTGMKIYNGPIFLNWEQKALLDAGAELKIMYEGKEIDRFKAELSTWYWKTTRKKVVRYVNKNRYAAYIKIVTSDMENEDKANEYKYEQLYILPHVDLDDPKYDGVAFYLCVDAPTLTRGFFPLCLEENVTLEFSADTVYQRNSDVPCCTFAEYYEEGERTGWMHERYGKVFEIQEEEGKIVRITGQGDDWN